MTSDSLPPVIGPSEDLDEVSADGLVPLKRPGRWWLWLPRVFIVFVIGFVALSATSLAQTALAAREAGSPFLGPAVVVALTVLFAAPWAVLAWQSTSRPYPDTDTMHVLSQSLDKTERRAVDRALRRGRVIAPTHRAYAVAKTAANRRALIFGGLTPALVWAQVANAASREFGSGFFWAMAVGAAVVTLLVGGAVAFQLLCERSLRAGQPRTHVRAR